MTDIAVSVPLPTKSMVTREEIITIIREGVLEYGDKGNPRHVDSNNKSCVYQKAFPRENENPWCIVGYVAYRMGWMLPNEDVIQGAGTVARNMSWPVSHKTQEWMEAVQCIFDGFNSGSHPDFERTWAQAAEICEVRGWQF